MIVSTIAQLFNYALIEINLKYTLLWHCSNINAMAINYYRANHPTDSIRN